MPILPALLSAALVVIALVHLAWAAGVTWPFASERDLARAVVGTRGIERMPAPDLCALVAAALLAAAAWPWLGGLGALRPLGLAALALVFLARGGASYVPALRALGPEEPLATYDRRLYGPLCLALGAGFAVLLLRAT